MPQKEMRHLMRGAVVLTLASFVAKLLSAIYRVPFQNLVGDEGFYVYQQVYPFYGIAMTLALTGLPQFISKCVAEKAGLAEQKRVLQQLMPLLLGLSLGLWGTVFFGSPLIAGLMGDTALQPLLRIVSFTFLLMPFLAYYRGYFQGQLQMMPTAVSQVSEQLLRVGVIIAAALLFQKLGWDIYQTGSLAMFGAVVGGLLAVVVLYSYDKRINGRQLVLRDWLARQKTDRKLVRRFLVEGGLLSIYSGYLILFQLVDAFLVKNSLVLQGMSEYAAKVSKGVYDRGQPLVQLGLVIATALSATFLPALTKHVYAGRQEQFEQNARMYLRLTASLALAAGFGLALLVPWINTALFKDDAGQGTLMLFVLAVALMALIQAYQSIAQSQNSFRRPLWAALWGLLGKLLATGPLTYLLGTAGASLATLFGLLLVLLCLIRQADAYVNFFWKERDFGFILLKCLGIMVTVLLVLHGVCRMTMGAQQRVGALLWALLGVVFGAGAFVAAAVRWRLFTIREWLTFPFGSKILRVMKRGK